MRFTIFSHVDHIYQDEQYFAYGPYVREMNLWTKHVDEVEIVAPLIKRNHQLIDLPYSKKEINFRAIPQFDITSLKSIVKTILHLPILVFTIFGAMKRSDHIHLRCPGNVGLLACIVQLFFPSKKKTAKYAGNWDPKAVQPISYRLQKWILSNTFLTKNMQVLVYGEWEGSSKNIKPFFTATYRESDKKEIAIRDLKREIRWMFVGTLSAGKQPLYALELFHKVLSFNEFMKLDFFGEGIERKKIEEYIATHQLEGKVVLHGNQTKEVVEKAYQNNHFLILPSKSEGWPKVVAEAMFWGCVPVATPVSCVSYMLDGENRGILLTMDRNKDIEQLQNVISNEEEYNAKSQKGMQWSQYYTLDYFEEEIKKLL